MVDLKNFDLNLLRALDALLEEKNVTHAGQRLFITQQAASGALQRLREHFGDPLLTPVGRRLELTPLALSLIHPVRERRSSRPRRRLAPGRHSTRQPPIGIAGSPSLITA